MGFPYRTRLIWTTRAHMAVRRGREVQLDTPPNLGRGAVSEVDYAPFLFGIVRYDCGPEQEMTPEERAAADEILRREVPTVPGAL